MNDLVYPYTRIVIDTPKAAVEAPGDLRRMAQLAAASIVAMVVVGGLISISQGHARRDVRVAGELLFFYIVPLGIFALHVLVHRGAMWQRLLLALPTTIVSCWLAHAVCAMLGMSWLAWGVPPCTTVVFELAPR